MSNILSNDSPVALHLELSDIATAKEVMHKAASELKDGELKSMIRSDLEILGVDQLGDNSVTILARIKTKPNDRWTVERAFREKVKTAFDKAGVSIPFPQQTLSFLNAPADGVDISLGAEKDDKPAETKSSKDQPKDKADGEPGNKAD